MERKGKHKYLDDGKDDGKKKKLQKRKRREMMKWNDRIRKMKYPKY